MRSASPGSDRTAAGRERAAAPPLRTMILAILCFAAACGAVAEPEVAGRIEPLRRRHAEGGVYRAQEAGALERARELFRRTFACREATPELRRSWAEEGFRLIEVRLEDGDALVIAEDDDRREGRGLYALRTSRAAAPVLLQAPHSFHDLHTGEIVARVFEETPLAAAAWNTVHRRGERDKERAKAPVDDDEGADLAHLDDTHFMAFLGAFAEAHPRGAVVQLHGFARARRRTEAGRSARVILSNGTEDAGDALERGASCLRDAAGGPIRVYPDDVRELGGTTNAQGRWIRARGLELDFLHVELSLEARRDLRRSPELRAALARCLAEE